VAAATGAARARSAVPRGQSTAFGGLGDVARVGLQGARQGVREARGTLSREDRADLTGRSRVGRAWLGSIAATEHATIAVIRAQQVAAHATVGRAHAAALAHAAVVDAGGADAEVRAAALASGGAATESLTAGHRTRHAQQVRATAEARRVAGHHQVDRDAESQVAATTAQADTARTTLMTPDQWADHLGERQHQPVATQLRHMSVERAATVKAQRDAIRPPGPGPADPGPRPPTRRTPPPSPPEPSPPAVSSDPPRPDPASPSPPARPASGSPPEPGVPATPPPRREARRPAGGERPTPSGPPPFAGPSHPAPPSPPPGSGADAERS
ncbi:MAG TPA: hypothetical protein VMW49_05355, partial [Candidatus Dormibacteraeota bacterium]|nr:hypothetical protein [Candidatus Dormibacteraeota bacterium]